MILGAVRWVRRVPALGVVLLVLLAPACGGPAGSASSGSSGTAAAGSPAPSFTLTDQFGRSERLSDFRGHVVLLSFIDSRCTTICPLTSQLMTEAEQALGPTYPVQLLAINTNPDFTSVSDVRAWSSEHRMLRRWLFLTGPVGELSTVWQSYGIRAKLVHGDVEHTAIVFLIDRTGAVRALFPIAEHGGIQAEALSIARAVRLLGSS
jgi:cytochrome oxidase Cu insertion factor (SCO1/SenC/PrrC family)